MTGAFFKSTLNPVLTAVATLAVMWLLLAFYGNFTAGRALLVSTAYSLPFAAAIRFYRLAERFMNSIVLRIVFVLLMQIAVTGMAFLTCLLLGIATSQEFISIIPLLFVFGTMMSGLITDCCAKAEIEQNHPSKTATAQPQPVNNNPALESGGELERISVKRGTEIHILKIYDVYYFESYGDYVFIYSENEKYIKEQTMRYFETNLPSSFVRIHRSHIINTSFIIRLELFGKENYYVRLKNGVSLKVSKTGYKLLKENLNL